MHFLIKEELLATCGWKNFWKIEDAVCWWIWAVVHMGFHLLLGWLPVRGSYWNLFWAKKEKCLPPACALDIGFFLSQLSASFLAYLYLLWKRFCILFRPLIINILIGMYMLLVPTNTIELDQHFQHLLVNKKKTHLVWFIKNSLFLLDFKNGLPPEWMTNLYSKVVPLPFWNGVHSIMGNGLLVGEDYLNCVA
jgi:hypothetical protein